MNDLENKIRQILYSYVTAMLEMTADKETPKHKKVEQTITLNKEYAAMIARTAERIIHGR